MSERRLATVERIVEIAPIPEADAIVRARIRGWDVVVKVDEFTVGDLCVYFEIDTLLPTDDSRFEFLASRGTKTDETSGVTGHVLKTAKLRGQVSQGLALPIAAFPEITDPVEGTDVTDVLGVTKWDPPLPAELVGSAKGYLPSWIPRTVQERIQNDGAVLTATQHHWIATEKIDGESTTFYVDENDEFGYATRTVDLIPNPGHPIGQLAAQHQFADKLRETWPGKRAAIQGEYYGEGVNKNPLRVNGKHFAAFNILVDGTPIPRCVWPEWALNISVPVYTNLTFPESSDQALGDVERLKSLIGKDRAAEGVVWTAVDATTVKTADGRMVPGSFKVISNRYLQKNG